MTSFLQSEVNGTRLFGLTLDELMKDGTVDVKAASEFLSLSRAKVYELMGAGDLPYVSS